MKPRGNASNFNLDTTSRIDNYKGNNLDYTSLCEPISSENEEKKGYNLSVDFLVNLKKLTTNKEIFQYANNMNSIDALDQERCLEIIA